MKLFKVILTLSLFITVIGQSLLAQDTTYFPNFTPYQQNPIIEYGDGMAGSPWNDPTVLKVNGQYIMYLSGVRGGLNHPNDTLAIYRWISPNGYNWTLNPTTSVLRARAGTYYEGGVETPSVVFYKGKYHMYNTVYRTNDPFQFKISHATSIDGISWNVDSIPVLEPSSQLLWMSQITAEPGAMVKNDTLYLFFTTAGSVGFQNIGLVRTTDGRTFFDSTLTATLPTNIYPTSQNYAGISTPSPLLIGDTIFLFTDVAQFVFGNNWMQVALHQFKSYGDLNKWYYDSIPIHTRADFSWTNGNYLAEIRSITPLLDNNRLRIWYAGHNISEIDTLLNDTINHVYFIGNELHVDSGHWAIGTSEYIFQTGIENKAPLIQGSITIQFQNGEGEVTSEYKGNSIIRIYELSGKLLRESSFKERTQFSYEPKGLFIVNVVSGPHRYSKMLLNP